MSTRVIRARDGRRLTVVGDRQTIKLTGAETGGAFALIEERNDPGTALPMHVHEREDETFIVLEGEVRFESEGTSTVAKPGDTVWAPRRHPHRWEVVGSVPARVLLVVSPAGLERMFEELAALPASEPDLARIGEICGRYGVRFV